MGDDPFDAHEAAVGGSLGRGQNEGVVEDVQSLVLHCPHVEIGHGNNVEHVEIVFAPEAHLVPFHRPLEGIHRPRAAVLFAGLDINAQIHRPS